MGGGGLYWLMALKRDIAVERKSASFTSLYLWMTRPFTVINNGLEFYMICSRSRFLHKYAWKYHLRRFSHTYNIRFLKYMVLSDSYGQ